jgi:polysaccharide export outer membrane protein
MTSLSLDPTRPDARRGPTSAGRRRPAPAAALLVAALGLAPGPGRAQQPSSAPPPAAPEAQLPAYRCRPGDVLKVFVWREAELSGEVAVRLDGRITIPLAGDVSAFDRTTTDIAEDIAARLTRYVEEPSVTVALLQANSARYFIIGEVAKPGVYPLDQQTSVLQALALAGGFGTFAKKDRVVIFRGLDGSEGYVRVDFEKLAGGDIKQNYILQPGDTILVP